VELANMKCPLGKTSNEKSELDKIPEHFMQAILVRLAKTQKFVESSLKYEEPDIFSIPSILGGREGGRGLLVPLRRGVVVFVKHGLLSCCVCETWLA